MPRDISVTFWGVRGSVAASGKHTAKYGGNTLCVEIRHRNTLIICDAGTGIRQLGLALTGKKRKPIKATILLSHMHWDHFMGLPFFEPLYAKKNHFIIAGPGDGRKSFKGTLQKVIAQPYFPITTDEFTAGIKFRTVSTKKFKIDDILVEPFSCHHPGGSLGWKFTFPNGKSLIHVSDNEPSLRNRDQMLRWMHDADMIIHDSQYSSGEYSHHRGWGHSPYPYSVAMAIQTNAKKLYMFHYDPSTDDRELERRVKDAQKIAKDYRSKLRVHLAREGRRVSI